VWNSGARRGWAGDRIRVTAAIKAPLLDGGSRSSRIQRLLQQTIVALSAFILAGLAGCASGRPAPLPPMPKTATSSSSLCQILVDRFIGLPEKLEAAGAPDAPHAGRWWIRSCQTDVRGADLHVRLDGPAWFWVDRGDSAFRVRQNVYFRVTADVVGRFRSGIGWERGVVSAWFDPSRANVQVEPLGELRASSQNPLVSILKRLSMPLPRWNVIAQARRLLEQEAAAELEHALDGGYTLLYDVGHVQPDFALGRLPAGKLPEHPFGNAVPWLANERLLVAPGALHVLGPFEAADALALDVRILGGSGIVYRAVCAPDLRSALESAERGDDARIPMTEIVDTGRIEPARESSVPVSSPDCSFYLVLSAAGEEPTRAEVRVRV
jgi:hypothetical protein